MEMYTHAAPSAEGERERGGGKEREREREKEREREREGGREREREIFTHLSLHTLKMSFPQSHIHQTGRSCWLNDWSSHESCHVKSKKTVKVVPPGLRFPY